MKNDDTKTLSVIAEYEHKKAIELRHLSQLELKHAYEVFDQRYLIIHASSGTFGIRLKLPNSNHKISAGLRCKVYFINDKKLSRP